MSKCTHCHGNGYTSYTENVAGHELSYNETCTHCGGKAHPRGKVKYGSGVEPGTCFPATTKILTKSGYRMMSDININSEVLSVGKDGLISYKKVMKKTSHKVSKIWHIHLSNGSLIRTTATHSFKSNGSWKKASQLTNDDSLVDSHGNEITVLKSYESKDIESVYNLIVEDNFTFIAEDILVHSFTYFRATRSLYWGIKKIFRKKRLDNVVTA